ncbi:MAG: DNA repair exonuclease [Desulfovibrio sp.]|jgi:DNA repair exonuclease SbcCD nuclease subunit|nr:DNA repair exonuclease [Desulfovibrio sp.]
MAEFTFVHAADLHLDAPFRGVSDMLLSAFSHTGRSGASERLARLLREATFIALRRLTELCIHEKADFLLLAGDVYNSADSSLRARLALRDSFARLEEHGVRVFLAHGNHDPLSPDVSAIPWPGNVTVFGRRLDSCQLTRQGELLAVIHGVSHTGPKENNNLARLFKDKGLAPHAPDVFQAGLLHCALTGSSGEHALYAPCAFSDLAAADMDYWALGHVHACRMLDGQGRTLPDCRDDFSPVCADGGEATHAPSGRSKEHGSDPLRPFAAYPGSPQGLHVNETGPHGCLLLRASGKEILAAEFVPLAPVRWESLHVEIPPNTSDIPSLETLLLETLSTLALRHGCVHGEEDLPHGISAGMRSAAEKRAAPRRRYSPEAIIARLILHGRSELNHELRKKGTDALLGERLNDELDGVGMWIRDVAVNTRPLTDLAAGRERSDIVGATLRRAFSLQQDPEALAVVAEQSLAPLFQRPKLSKVLSAPQDEELFLLAEEAALLCLDLLEGE